MTGMIDASVTRTHVDARNEDIAGGRERRVVRAHRHKALLAAHVATTVGVLGADLALLALGVAGANGSEPATVYPAAHRIGAWVIAPLAVASLGTGVLLGASTRWGLVTYWWVAIKLAVTVALTAMLLLVLVPALGDAAAAVPTPTAHELADTARRRLAIAPIIASVLLALNVALAVYKPGGRVRPAHRRSGADPHRHPEVRPSRT